MAITKVTRNLLSTGIDDQSNATAITIDSSGNLKLSGNGHISLNNSDDSRIAGDGDSIDFNLWDNTSAYQTRMTILDTGNVGIGNSSPLGNLTISNAAGANAPTTVTAANTYLQLGSDDYGPSSNGKFMIGFGYTDATNTNSPAYIGFEETSNSGDTKGELTFYTRDVITDTAPSERMRITDGGNVGIGNSSPTRNLTVGDTAASSVINIKSSATNGYSTLALGDSGDDNYAQILLDNGTNKLQIQNGGGGALGNRGITLDSSENVGIGTSSPSAPLHVDAAGMGDVYSGLIENTTTDTDHYNVVRFMQGASGSATGFIGTGGSTTSNTTFRNTFVVGTQSSNDFVVATNDTERMRILSNGSFCIGGTAVQAVKSVSWNRVTNGYVHDNNTTSGAGNGHEFQTFRRNSTQIGSIVMNGTTGVTYSTTSDGRLKDVTGEARGLEVINELNPVAYNWKEDGRADEGLIAQEVQEIVPNAVSQNSDDYYQMDYSKLVVHLVKAVKEQQTIIDNLTTRIETLENA